MSYLIQEKQKVSLINVKEFKSFDAENNKTEETRNNNAQEDKKYVHLDCSNATSGSTNSICPYAHSIPTGQSPLLGSKGVNMIPTTFGKNIPREKRFSMWNIMKMNRRGHRFFLNKMLKHNSSVYKVKCEEERIMICDHVGLQVLYDPDKVDKMLGFGTMDYNPVILRNYVPAMFSNDDEHRHKKDVALQVVKHVTSTHSVEDLNEIIAEQFRSLKPIENLNKKSAMTLDFEDVIQKAVASVITKILLGENIDDLKLLENWLEKTVEFRYGFDWTDEDEISVADKLFQKIEATPTIKNLKEIVKSDSLSDKEIVKEIIWMTVFNAFGGCQNVILSALATITRLHERDRTLLEAEANLYLTKTDDSVTLESLPYINAFILEIIRLFPPAVTKFGRAEKDFLLESTSGTFKVNKNELLCGYVYAAQRDANLFDQADEFSIHRPREQVERYIYTFGGHISNTPSTENGDCPGKYLALKMVKLFTIHLLKCTIIPFKYPAYTGRNYARGIGTDDPIKIQTFMYNQ